jgi:hypothetical protein
MHDAPWTSSPGATGEDPLSSLCARTELGEGHERCIADSHLCSVVLGLKGPLDAN